MQDLTIKDRSIPKASVPVAEAAVLPTSARQYTKPKQLTVLIIGIDTANKGACLMLDAVRERMSSRFGKTRFVVDFRTPIDARLELGLWATWPSSWKSLRLTPLGNMLPRSISARFGIVSENEVDIVVDASGFAYGDYWGVDKFRRRVATPIRRWKAANKTIIMMPQAWGPFDPADFGETVADALRHADLAFARDPESARHLRAAGVRKFSQAPDFTTLLDPSKTEATEQWKGHAFLVPNAKMIATGDEVLRERYIRFLISAADMLSQISSRTSILVHESRSDRPLAEAVQSERPNLQIVLPTDHRAAKAMLAGASAVISSRFHGLVSALSSGVPSFACGWSHKYQALMEDYGSSRFMADIHSEETWAPSLSAFRDAVVSGSLKASLESAAREQKSRTEAMWTEIFDVIAANTGYTQ